MEGNREKAKILVSRIEPLVSQYSGSEREFIDSLIDEFNRDPEYYENEIDRLTLLAQQGDPGAQYELAAYYADGRGVEQDHKKAIELYETAADKDLLVAQYYMGVIYDKGRGGEPDYIKARKWFKVSAERGYAISQYNYGVYLEIGRGGLKNESEAWEWIKKSASQGYSLAKRALMDHEQKK